MYNEDFWWTGWGFVTMFVICIIGVVVLAALLTAGSGFLCFDADKTEIEQLRLAAETAQYGENEDILGMVAETNQNIAVKQQYNRKWWAGWAIPDGWDLIEPIDIKNTPTR